ncbi:hypothetical protein D3C77_574020 [compost metagenome]
MAQDLDHAQLLFGLLCLASLGFLEDWRVVDAGTDPVADQHHHRREPERHTPAPGEELLFGQGARQQEQGQGRDQVARRHSGLRPAGPEAATVVRAVLGHQQDGAAPFAAKGKALDQP